MTRIELVTPSLPRKCSTPELHRLINTSHKNEAVTFSQLPPGFNYRVTTALSNMSLAA